MTDPQHDIERLLLDAYHPDAKTRHTAIFALGKITDPRAYAVLLALLQDDEEWVVTAAAYMLGETGDTTLTPRLLTVFEHGTPPQQHALMSPLVKLDGVAMLPVLMPYLAHPIATLLMGLLTSDDPMRRRWVLACFQRDWSNPRFRDGLYTALSDPDRHLRGIAATYLADRGDVGAVEPLLALLNDPLCPTNVVLRALVKLNQPVPAEQVARFLNDETPSIRRAAAILLGRLGHPTAVETLLEGLSTEKDPTTRNAMLEALAHNHDARVVPALEGLLTHPAQEIRCAALAVVARMRPPSSWPLVAAALSERDGVVKMAAIAALGAYGDGRAVALLVPLLQADNPAVQVGAAHALRAIGTPDALAAVERWTQEQNT